MANLTGYTGRGVSLTSRVGVAAAAGEASSECLGKLTKLDSCRCWPLMTLYESDQLPAD